MEDSVDVVKVIDRTALIENLLNQVIEDYFGPRKETSMMFWNVLMDSSIIPLGAKVKVVMAVAQECSLKIDPNPIHKMISIRNAFAHHSINSHPTIAVSRDRSQERFHFVLHVLNQNGKITKIRREDAVEEFNQSYKSAYQALIDLKAQILKCVPPNA